MRTTRFIKGVRGMLSSWELLELSSRVSGYLDGELNIFIAVRGADVETLERIGMDVDTAILQ
jgi:hypothetical protein